MPSETFENIGSYGSMHNCRNGGGGGGDGDDGDGDGNGSGHGHRPPPFMGGGGGGSDGDGEDGPGGDGNMENDNQQPNLLHRLRIPMPEAFTSDGDLTFTEWQVVMCRWLRSNGVEEARWLHVFINNLKGPALKWMNLVNFQIARRQRGDFATWREWANEARRKFEPTTLEEVARAQLRKVKQFGSVQSYVPQFQHICFRIPNLTEGEAYSVFTFGLK